MSHAFLQQDKAVIIFYHLVNMAWLSRIWRGKGLIFDDRYILLLIVSFFITWNFKYIQEYRRKYEFSTDDMYSVFKICCPNTFCHFCSFTRWTETRREEMTKRMENSPESFMVELARHLPKCKHAFIVFTGTFSINLCTDHVRIKSFAFLFSPHITKITYVMVYANNLQAYHIL